MWINFKFHCEFAHINDRDLKCGTCDLSFTTHDSRICEKHKKMEHNIGPCPHCTKIGLNLKFISKERFKKHQFALCHYAKKELNVDENASTANYKISTTVLFASTLVVN